MVSNKKKRIKILIDKYKFPFFLSLSVIFYQALIYFFAKFTPMERHLVGNAIDSKIPFLPIFIVPYIFWYVFLVILPCILYEQDKKTFYWYLVSNFIVDTIATIIFIFYPTYLIRPEIPVDSIFTWLVNLIYWGDTPALNCFPSIHCANCFVAIFIMIKSNKIKKEYRFTTTLFSLIIIASTFLVKQHVLIDGVGAFFLALFITILVKKLNIHTFIQEKIERKR